MKVEIVRTKTGEVVQVLRADSYRSAERIERGVSINLNHDDYYARIVEVDR